MDDGDDNMTVADRIYEGAQLLKQLSDVEGRPIPELDAILSDDPRARLELIEIDDDLERLGRRYARLSHELLIERRYRPQRRHPPEGPTPLQVIAWYCMLIPAKIFGTSLKYGQTLSIAFYAVTLPTLLQTFLLTRAATLGGLFWAVYFAWAILGVAVCRGSFSLDNQPTTA